MLKTVQKKITLIRKGRADAHLVAMHEELANIGASLAAETARAERAHLRNLRHIRYAYDQRKLYLEAMIDDAAI